MLLSKHLIVKYACLYMYYTVEPHLRNHPAHVRARVYECREVHTLFKHSRNGEVCGKLLSETRRLSR